VYFGCGGGAEFYYCSEYVSVSFLDNTLAVDPRVQYTKPMLWKFKKQDSQPPHTSAAHAAATPQPTGERLGSGGATKVENIDVIAKNPSGSFVIPASYRVSGTIVTPRHVAVEGELEGPALVAPSVHVAGSGRLNVPTQAATVTVSGVVEQPVVARDLLEVRSGGALRADVEAGTLNIQPGGQISGARLAIGPYRADG
jgi:cytoskeletal protein CcmA (bactofilin family)